MEKRIDNIQQREFATLSWHDPRQILINLRLIELGLPDDIDPRVRRLRTNTLKEWREGRDAALFAWGLGAVVLGIPVAVAKSEQRDYDFVCRWEKDGKLYYYPVQLKELPPADLNASVSLDDIYAKLSKYSGRDDLAVAINVNRQFNFKYEPWSQPTRPKILELWLFGCTSPDQSEWMIYGNVLATQPRFLTFSYPLPDTGPPTDSRITKN